MWIGGKWVDASSGKTFGAFNPATGEEIGRVPLADKTDIDKAVEAARSASAIWSQKTPAERSDILYKIADAIAAGSNELAELDLISHGAPIKMAKGGLMGLPGMFKYAAQASRSFMGQVIPARPDKFFYLQHEPRGVCALIVAWNAPLVSTSKKLSACLATGNTCIIKPPSVCSLTVLKLGEILEKVGLPPGTINIVTGPGGSVGEVLAAHSGINMVSFTGSAETGKRILAVASSSVKKVALELGGKNPWIVMEDADIDAAVANSMFQCFANTGMTCASTGRYYLHENIHEQFIEKFLVMAKKLVVGDPNDENTFMGPLVSAEHRDKVEGLIKSGVEDGAKLILGGKRPINPLLEKGYYVSPTIFTGVTQNMRIAREEIFGPVAVFIKVTSQDNVVAMANDTNYGLAASIWTKDIPKALRMANELQTGTVWINGDVIGPPEYPWGGYKESGFGKELSILGLEEYIQTKAICFDITGSK